MYKGLGTEVSRFTPHKGAYESVDMFVKNCQSEISRIDLKKSPDIVNIARNEIEALKKLKNRTDIVIRPADKGGAVCVWDKDSYRTEAYRQLDDNRFYERLDTDETGSIQKDLEKEIKKMIKDGTLSEEAKHLVVKSPRSAAFYLLPKIHKVGIPRRPVVSNINCPTYLVSKFLSRFLKPLNEQCPTYIKDTTHLLQKIETGFILGWSPKTHGSVPCGIDSLRASPPAYCKAARCIALRSLVGFSCLSIEKQTK